MSEIGGLLEKLKQLDPATYEEITHFESTGYHEPRNQALAWLQFCVQRAISAKRYHLLQSQDTDDGQYYAEISKVAPGYDGDTKTEKHLYLIAGGKGPSPVSALLACYIACLESQPCQN